ncbi:MAG: hypothetical protein IKQ39_04870 [Oscillospiraceae bacterium]|nr:hypothetical protein [Oscillospiraceae bacterium]
MTLISLPMILYVLPVITVVTIAVPPKRKPLVLALGGLSYVWLTGGFQALTLMLLMIVSAWLVLRLQPTRIGGISKRRILTWMYAGVGIQFFWLLAAKLLLPEMQLIPLVLCAMQNTEYICARANRQVSVPGLFPFFCYASEAPRLFAGPPMHPETAENMWEQRKFSAENLGAGAAVYIRGLFQLACLALPMQHLHAALTALVPARTIADTWLLIAAYYFALYFGLKGAAQIGQGIALMIGLEYPDSFDSPILAGTQYGFWTRFMMPVSKWAERVLCADRTADAFSYFARAAVTMGGLGLMLGQGVGGMLWGVCSALVLTGERMLNPKWIAQIPIAARRVVTAVLMLFFLGLLRCGSVSELFSFYGGIFGKNGLMFSSRAAYFIKNNWFTLLLCAAAALPLRKMLLKYAEEKKWRRTAAQVIAVCMELTMTVMSMAELMSNYLGNR